MFAVRDQEGVHGAGALKTRHRGADVKGLAGFDGHIVFAAVDNLGNYGFVAEVDVLELGAEADVDHLRGGDKKRVRGLCKTDSGACPPKDKNHHCDFTCWVLSAITALYSVPFIIILCCHV